MNELLIESSKQLPLVHFKWVFLKGSASDNREHEGLTNYAMELYRRGSKSKTRNQINQHLAEVCSSVSVHISDEMTTFSALLPSQSLDEFSKRLCGTIEECSPSDEACEDLQNEIVEEQNVSLENPMNQCVYLYTRSLYEEDLYGNFILGRPDLLKTYSKKQAETKREELLSDSGYVLISGDKEEKEAEKSLHYFDSFSINKKAKPELIKPYEKIDGPKLALCHDPNQDQASIIIGWTADRLKRDDFPAATMVEKILCKEYSSNLCQDFRQRAGLTYGIYGAYRHTLRGSHFTCRTQTASKFGPHFLEDLIQVFQTFAKGEGVYHLRNQDGETIKGEVDFGKEKCDQYRNKIINSMPFLSYTSQAKLARRLEEKFFESPICDEQWLKSQYLALNQEKLIEMSRQLFSVSGFVVAIVDNMKKNAEAYKKLHAWTKITEIENKKSLLCGQN